MNKIISFVILTFVFSISNANARKWERITIPGATCGSGTPYSIFVNNHNKDQRKLGIELMGGGACWSLATCYGPKIQTWMFPIPKLPVYSVYTTENPELTPAHDHMMIYFPYCTGDVFAGRHTAEYRFGVKAHHQGASNLEKSLQYIIENQIIDIERVEDVLISGSSAGGLGALLNLEVFDQIFAHARKKTLLVDAAGMHWGREFWMKFTVDLISDFTKSMRSIGVNPELNNGLLASQMAKVCNRYFDWNIGFLQDARDPVMSEFFGDISKNDHRKQVYGKKGIFEVTKKVKNCAAWVPDHETHTFLLGPHRAILKAGERSAIDFSYLIYNGRTSTNFR